MKWQITVEHDQPDFFRLTRVGNWLHVFFYANGRGLWEWDPEQKKMPVNPKAHAEFLRLTDRA